MNYSKGFHDWLFGERVTIDWTANNGQVVRLRVTRRWLDQARAVGMNFSIVDGGDGMVSLPVNKLAVQNVDAIPEQAAPVQAAPIGELTRDESGERVQRFRVTGVNRETAEDVDIILEAMSAANAKVKAELRQIIVTDLKEVKPPPPPPPPPPTTGSAPANPRDSESTRIATPSQQPQPRGIGGWLVLPAIGLVGGSITGPYYMYLHLRILGILHMYESYPPLTLLSIAYDTALYIATICVAVLFFNKRRSTIYAMKMLLSARLIGYFIGFMQIEIDRQSTYRPAYNESDDLTHWIRLIIATIFTLAWILYFAKSKRVANTFV